MGVVAHPPGRRVDVVFDLCIGLAGRADPSPRCSRPCCRSASTTTSPGRRSPRRASPDPTWSPSTRSAPTTTASTCWPAPSTAPAPRPGRRCSRSLIGIIVGGSIGDRRRLLPRGRSTGVVGIFTNSLLAVPPLILLIALATVLDPNLRNIALALSRAHHPEHGPTGPGEHHRLRPARVRARRPGDGRDRRLRVMVRELTPNVVLPVLSLAMVMISVLIVAEASLSFLGLGIQPPEPTWGNMISEGQGGVMRAAPVHRAGAGHVPVPDRVLLQPARREGPEALGTREREAVSTDTTRPSTSARRRGPPHRLPHPPRRRSRAVDGVSLRPSRPGRPSAWSASPGPGKSVLGRTIMGLVTNGPATTVTGSVLLRRARTCTHLARRQRRSCGARRSRWSSRTR